MERRTHRPGAKGDSGSTEAGVSAPEERVEFAETAETAQPVAVPYAELAPDLLHAVVESYVLREGTDYGEREYSLEDKVTHVIRQLERGEAHIVFDPQTETVSIVKR